MSRQALCKDFFVEIKGSLNRFLSILFIVAMGVAFFSGIRAAEPDMRLSADEYFDERRMMDLRVIGTLGLTQDDADVLASIDGVLDVEPSYMTDVKSDIDDNEQVLHLEALTDLNAVTLVEGRMPAAEDECLIEVSAMEGYGLSVGDALTFRAGGDDSLSDTLKNDCYTIVGSCASPLYISFDKGTTTIGSGKVNAVAYLPKSAFRMEAFSQIWLTVEGASEQTAYTDDYDEVVEAVRQKVAAMEGARCEIRYNQVTADARQEIQEADNQLEDARQEAQTALDDARNELEAGQRALDQGKKELSDKKAELDQAAQQLKASREQLDRGWQDWSDGQSAFKTGQAEYDAGREELEQAEARLDSGRATVAQTAELLEQKRAELSGGELQWLAQKELYDQGLEQLQAGETALSNAREQLQQLEQLIEAGLANEEQLAAAQTLKSMIGETERELIKTRQALEQAGIELDDARIELDDGRLALEQGETALSSQRTVLEAAELEIEQNRSKLETAARTLAQSREDLDEARATLLASEAEYTAALAQIEDGRAQLQAAESTLSDQEKELSDGWEQYEQARQEAREQLDDGAKELEEAKQALNDLSAPEWYITDRASVANYTGYGENADRMRAIGQVFPVIFFLVAALVSLTTMTRMVEEERTQIGTLKALGYGKGSIAIKYLGYALLATVGGSVVGLAIGQKIFPWVIIRAYGILYPYMTNLVIPYHLNYSVMAVGAALLCTLTATWFSCYRALRGQPAELMRPEAPKSGKRVLLERVAFLWKHLSFTWKSTVRNLFRYKKRFFMTVFGIGGCMALMLVGFGLKDSIMDIARLQYQKIQLYDAMAIVSDTASDAEQKRIDSILQTQSSLDSYTRVQTKLVTAQHDGNSWDVYLTVPESLDGLDRFLQFHDRKTGEVYSLNDDGAILTEKAAKQLGVGPGDTLSLQLDSGMVDVPISAVCENYLQHYIYLSPALFEKASASQPDFNAIVFRMAQGQENELEEVCEALLADGTILAVNYSTNLEEQLNDMLKSLDAVILVLIVSAGMLAFVVLYNLNNININERRRELATLKVLGFYDQEVSVYVFRENILLTLIGTLAGCVFGVILHRFIIETVEIDMCMFGRNINLPSFIYSILCTLIFSALVNFAMHYKLKKIDMVESLKSVE